MTGRVPAGPVRRLAAREALATFSAGERSILKSLARSHPYGAFERSLWRQYLVGVERESRRLQDTSNWTVPDLLEVLSRAQQKAMAIALRRDDWKQEEAVRVLRSVVGEIIPWREEVTLGAEYRHAEPYTTWSAWQGAHERTCATLST